MQKAAEGQVASPKATKTKAKEPKSKSALPETQAAPTAVDDSHKNATVYCICRSSDEQNMIMCDKCEEWYHYNCINLSPVSIDPSAFNFHRDEERWASLLDAALWF